MLLASCTLSQKCREYREFQFGMGCVVILTNSKSREEAKITNLVVYGSRPVSTAVFLVQTQTRRLTEQIKSTPQSTCMLAITKMKMSICFRVLGPSMGRDFSLHFSQFTCTLPIHSTCIEHAFINKDFSPSCALGIVHHPELPFIKFPRFWPDHQESFIS